jgi:hypothetical protein
VHSAWDRRFGFRFSIVDRVCRARGNCDEALSLGTFDARHLGTSSHSITVKPSQLLLDNFHWQSAVRLLDATRSADSEHTRFS